MKPKDLKPPYSWDERRVLLKDRILYVPSYFNDYGSYTFPGWEEIFENSNPVHIEYCSGNGAWIAEKAREFPNINWVAVEIRFDRVRKIWAKQRNEQLSNLFVIHGEGVLATEKYIPTESVSKVYVNFPDPWPKDRHAKHRIIQRPFVQQVNRVLSANGEIMLVTDDATYSEQMIVEMLNGEQFESAFEGVNYQTTCDGYGNSWFEELWRDKGREIRYHRFRKKELVRS